jgi:uncharacterized protein YjeT (DUF2065 family)
MDINWSDLLNAIALVLIIEGLLPFLSPARLKKTYESMQQLPDAQLRKLGFVSIMLGALLLLFI